MDESRKQFEEWLKTQNELPWGISCSSNNLMWKAWKASRESIRKEMEVDEWDLK